MRADIDPALAARLISAVMDGIQLQWLLDESVDMVPLFDEFVRRYLHPADPWVLSPGRSAAASRARRARGTTTGRCQHARRPARCASAECAGARRARRPRTRRGRRAPARCAASARARPGAGVVLAQRRQAGLGDESRLVGREGGEDARAHGVRIAHGAALAVLPQRGERLRVRAGEGAVALRLRDADADAETRRDLVEELLVARGHAQRDAVFGLGEEDGGAVLGRGAAPTSR